MPRRRRKPHERLLVAGGGAHAVDGQHPGHDDRRTRQGWQQQALWVHPVWHAPGSVNFVRDVLQRDPERSHGASGRDGSVRRLLPRPADVRGQARQHAKHHYQATRDSGVLAGQPVQCPGDQDAHDLRVRPKQAAV
ncbi:MAG: hypothetical protein CMM87_05705 [Rickettsiales bacterium]|nr:hypothetical protein [Rickettsiales bacterium]